MDSWVKNLKKTKNHSTTKKFKNDSMPPPPKKNTKIPLKLKKTLKNPPRIYEKIPKKEKFHLRWIFVFY
jgi:hypothetical protein